ncbi:MAG: glycerophosphodiester phosphodiesterase [Nitrospirota bacterium]
MLLKIGHRGAKAYETENTLESFSKAIELGANAIELDVRMSADDQVIVSHDDSLKKVYAKDTLIRGATLQELKALTGGRIATLQEALHAIGRKVEKILVELKESGYEHKVLEIIRQEELEDRVILVSFLGDALARVRALHPTIETGLVYNRLGNPIEAALKVNARYLLPLYRFVHRRDIAKAHRSNLKVIVWTVNSRAEAENFAAKDADGIATDKPDIFQGIS